MINNVVSENAEGIWCMKNHFIEITTFINLEQACDGGQKQCVENIIIV